MVAGRGKWVSGSGARRWARAGLSASSPGTGLVETMGEDGLGVCRRPSGRAASHPVADRRMQAEKKVAYVTPGSIPMTLRAGQDRA